MWSLSRLASNTVHRLAPMLNRKEKRVTHDKHDRLSTLPTLGSLCSSLKGKMLPTGVFYVQLDYFLEDFIQKQPDRGAHILATVASALTNPFIQAHHPIQHLGTCSTGHDFVIFVKSPCPQSTVALYTESVKQLVRTGLASLSDIPGFVVSRPVQVYYSDLDVSHSSLESLVHIIIKQWNMSADNSSPKDHELRALLGQILVSKSISCVYQPIISLRTGTVFGYEALTRGLASTPLENPVALFSKAQELGCLFELEVLAKEVAIRKAAPVLGDKYLFLNVSPLVINDHNHRQGITKSILQEHGLDTDRVVLELTERDVAPDPTAFREVLKYYRRQGFLIAVDDMGAGYSNLKAIADLQPEFIKLDMSLVRDVDKNYTKKALLETLCTLAAKTGSRIVAEGVETAAELEILFDIGCDYCQGYLFGKPGKIGDPINLTPYDGLRIKRFANSSWRNHISLRHIGSIVTQDFVVAPQTKVEEVTRLFENNRLSNGVVVCEGETPIGLVMRHRLNSILATRFGHDLFIKRDVASVMKKHCLMVSWDTPLEEVALRLAEMGHTSLENCESGSMDDYVVVTKDDKYFGVVSILKLIDAIAKNQIEQARDANPLTGLPGNRLITERMASDLAEKKPIAVLYLDLDNFKAFNDRYGFERGDSAIALTAQITSSAVTAYGNPDDLVGHIGGDDFVVITSPDRATHICKKIIEEFDKSIVTLYDKSDLEQGYITTVNRRGESAKIPIMSLSIAGVINHGARFSNHLEISETAAEIKKYVKSINGSSYLFDRKLQLQTSKERNSSLVK